MIMATYIFFELAERRPLYLLLLRRPTGKEYIIYHHIAK